MFRANEWLAGTDARQRGGIWFFPSGATLSFGGLDKKGDEFKFQGAQYSYIGVDELTQLNPRQFEYVISSRLRKPGCDVHKETRDPSCRYCSRYMHTASFPLRIRTATNPGGRCHLYVKQRYMIGPVKGKLGPSGRQLYAGQNPTKPHIPAFIEDNPFLDKDDYVKMLEGFTDPVTRDQLLAGDWGVSADGRFRKAWVRRWKHHGHGMIYLEGHDRSIRLDSVMQFLTVDTASSVKETPGRTEHGKKLASYTVVARWGITPQGELMLFHIRRAQVELPGIEKMIRDEMQAAESHVAFVGIEHTTQSIHLYQYLNSRGLNLRPFPTRGQDKIQRSISVANMMEQGKVFLPNEPSKWLTEYEDEIFTWTGGDEETDDQVDVTSYAGIWATQHNGRSMSAPALG